MVRTYDCVPARTYILTEGCQMPLAERVRTMLSVLLTEYREHHEIQLVRLQTDAINEVTTRVREIADREEAGQCPGIGRDQGTKPMVMGAVLPALQRHLFDNIFYLQIGSLRNAGRTSPYRSQRSMITSS